MSGGASLRRLIVRGGAVVALVGASALVARPAGAQRRPAPAPTPAPAPPVRAPAAPVTRGDTLRRPLTARDSAMRDSIVRDSIKKNLVQWAETDSVIDALLQRPGYSVTRYQGKTVVFEAETRRLTLVRDSAARAAVGRDQTLIVSDTIVYDDSLRIVRARGRENVIRDPARGDDVLSTGSLSYDLAAGTAQVGAVRTTLTSGQKYYVAAERAAFVNDSTGEEEAFFGRQGSITTCEDSLPHYRFQSRELKLVAGRLAIGRPAVLYLYDVPVFWLPFVFQDIRRGRRSGMLTPRFGFSEILRQNQGYRRNIENLGYYFNISEYQDLSFWLDWRSGAQPAGATPAGVIDPGFLRMSGEWRYRWLNRFVGGRIALSQTRLFDDQSNLQVAWTHQQEFSRRTRLTANVNYTSDTRIQRQVGFNPQLVMSTIRSDINFQSQRGPLTFAIGANRTQFPGREQVDQTLPTISVTSRPLRLGNFVTWTPSLQGSEQRRTDQPLSGNQGELFQPTGTPGVFDTIRVRNNDRNTSLGFETPITIGRTGEQGTASGFAVTLGNSFRLTDRAQTLFRQQTVEEIVPREGGGLDTVRSVRIFDGYTETQLDWQTQLQIPAAFGRGTWNITPSIQFVNADQGSAFFVRSTLSGGRWVSQSKRPQFSLSASPTLFGFFRGIGPVARIRHQISPTLSWSLAPRGNVSDEFLAATGRFRSDFIGAQPQNIVSLGLQQNIEVKLRAPADSAPEAGRKVRALAIQTDALSYDFNRLRTIRERSSNPSQVSPVLGLTSNNWGLGLRSDFLPGFDFGMRWSLFQGNTQSDTATFEPFREEVRMSLQLDRKTGVIDWLVRKLGGGKFEPAQSNLTAADSMQLRNNANQNMFGTPLGQVNQIRPAFSVIPSGQGWRVSLNYTENRQRPPRGTNVLLIDVEQRCAFARALSPLAFQQCIATNGVLPGNDPNANQFGFGGPIFVNPPLRTMALQTSFNLTPKWAASWSTSYDLTRQQFAAQQVSLQRELHDWRMSMNFTQAPNGNFLFSFFIALKASPDIRLPYDQQTFRRPDTGN